MPTNPRSQAAEEANRLLEATIETGPADDVIGEATPDAAPSGDGG